MSLVAFDLDGTWIEGHVDRPDPDGPFVEVLPFLEVRPLPGVHTKLHELLEQGKKLAVCTNKAGVAFGHSTEEECAVKKASVLEAFELSPLDVLWYEAYGHEEATVERYRSELHLRKPAPGMLLRAMADSGEEPGSTVFVGDMPTDYMASLRAGCGFVWAKYYFGWDDG